MNEKYEKKIQADVDAIFTLMAQRVDEKQMNLLHKAYDFAAYAHKGQLRKSGEPYISHPVAVARIVAEELELGANPVMAAFQHDVVEDCPYSIDEIRERFGDDVAFLVGVVTKQKKAQYDQSKQVDNFRQMLSSVQFDVRAILVKLADRLHNMRTLSSMRPDKQMKIASETDYFYAPLANRLGLYNVKTELENLSFRYRCPGEYEQIEKQLAELQQSEKPDVDVFIAKTKEILEANGIDARIELRMRSPYSIWRKMQSKCCDFEHIDSKHYLRIIYKADGSSERMIRNNRLGCTAERTEENLKAWLEKFRAVLKDIAYHTNEMDYKDGVTASFYHDNIMAFTPKGKCIVLPKYATALDFAFEIHTEVGLHAVYARINGKLSSVKTVLHRGDCVEIGTAEDAVPEADWQNHVLTYKAKRSLGSFFTDRPKMEYKRCTCCHPLPGDEVVGFKNTEGQITLHKRNCLTAIRQASKQGDTIVAVDFKENELFLFPVRICIRGIDRLHLLSDVVACITEQQNLSISKLHTVTQDRIVETTVDFEVHSSNELKQAIENIRRIKNVDEVARIDIE